MMSFRKPWWETVAVMVVLLIAAAATLLAASNLLRFMAVLPSATWLLFMLVGISIKLRTGGLRGLLRSFLSCFSRTEILCCCRSGDGPAEVSYGFRSFGVHVVTQSFRLDRLCSLEWGAGQATEMTGRDMSDWSVWLWYQHGDRSKLRQRSGHRKPDQEICEVGRPQARQDAEALAQEVREYLQEAGASLVRVPEECRFEQPQPSAS